MHSAKPTFNQSPRRDDTKIALTMTSGDVYKTDIELRRRGRMGERAHSTSLRRATCHGDLEKEKEDSEMKSIQRLSAVCFALALSVGLPAPARAAGTTQALVSGLGISGTQFAYVSLSIPANVGTRPSCHAALRAGYYAFDISTVKGKALYGALQAAQLAGKQVTVSGTGTTCTTYVNSAGTSISLETLYEVFTYT